MDCARNIVTAFLGGGTTVTTAPLYQWDYGQILLFSGLELPFSFEVHFSNTERRGDSTTSIGEDNSVTIPDIYLTTGKPVYAWIYLHDSETDGETEYAITIPVIQRPRPTHETPTPVQQSEIEQLIDTMNDAVDAAQASAKDADDSAGEAAGSVEEASEYAKDAEAWAVGQCGGVDVPSDAPQYENNSKYWADKAEQSAAEAGYMSIEIDENGHLIYYRTTSVDVDLELVDGHLIMEVG